MAERESKKSKERYVEAVGRRKTALARVRLFESKNASIEINGKELSLYFPTKAEQEAARSPLQNTSASTAFRITALVRGGGVKAQSEALRHGISRALVRYDQTLRGALKQRGYLKRDPRVKERRKFGLKKARRAPQWSKR